MAGVAQFKHREVLRVGRVARVALGAPGLCSLSQETGGSMVEQMQAEEAVEGLVDQLEIVDPRRAKLFRKLQRRER